MTHEVFTFGPFGLDPVERVLLRGSTPIPLTPKALEVLLVLVERPGELVDKAELLDRVWRGLTVEECNLSQHVASLRRAFDDDPRTPAYIETVPRRGYRFVAPVTLATRTPVPLAAPAAMPSGAPAEDPAATGTNPSGPPPRPFSWRGFARSRAAWSAVGVGLLLLAVAQLGSTARPRPTLRSLAVLPVQNLTGQRRNARVAEALTEGLGARLAREAGVEVRAAATLPAELPLEGSEPSHAAGVDVVVECSIVGGEDRLKVVAELIDARTDRLIWADVFESDPVAFPNLEERISEALLARIVRTIAGGVRAEPATGRAAARREYELARFYLGERTPQIVREALEHFRAVVGLDPDYAPGHAGLAEALLLAVEHRVAPPSPALELASAEAHRALDLSPQLAEAHATLGGIAAARWDFAAAEASFQQALLIDPAMGIALQRYATLLTVLDRHAEAIAKARSAVDLEPTSAVATVGLAAAYLHAGLLEDALAQARSALRLAPRMASAYAIQAGAYQASGRNADALAALGEALRLSDRNPVHLAALARLRARSGSPDLARELLAELQHPAPGRTTCPLDVAAVQVALGDRDAAFRALEQAVDRDVPWLQPSETTLGLAELHEDPRFPALVVRMRERSRVASLAVPESAGAAVPR